MAATRRSATLPPHTHRRAIHRWVIRRPATLPRPATAGSPGTGSPTTPVWPGARLRPTAAAGSPNLGAGDHPVAAAEPERHLQRRGGLRPGQPQSHPGADGRRRRDHANPYPRRGPGTTGCGQPNAYRPIRGTHRRRRGGVDALWRAQRAGRLAGRRPADRHARGRRRPSGLRLDNRRRRNLGQDPRTAARADRAGGTRVDRVDSAVRCGGGDRRGHRRRGQRRSGNCPRFPAGAGRDRGAWSTYTQRGRSRPR